MFVSRVLCDMLRHYYYSIDKHEQFSIEAKLLFSTKSNQIQFNPIPKVEVQSFFFFVDAGPETATDRRRAGRWKATSPPELRGVPLRRTCF